MKKMEKMMMWHSCWVQGYKEPHEKGMAAILSNDTGQQQVLDTLDNCPMVDNSVRSPVNDKFSEGLDGKILNR
jgi:hypothetical protein